MSEEVKGHHAKTEEILRKIEEIEKIVVNKLDEVSSILKEKVYVEKKAGFYQSLIDFIKSPPIQPSDILEIPQDLKWSDFKYVVVETVHPLHNLFVVFAPTELGGVVDFIEPDSEVRFSLSGKKPEALHVQRYEMLHLKPKRLTFPFKLNIMFADVALRSTFKTAKIGIPYTWIDEVENIELFICSTTYCPDIEFVIYNPWDFQIPQIPGKTEAPPYPIFVPPVLGGYFMGWRYIIKDILEYDEFRKWLLEKHGIDVAKLSKDQLETLKKENLRNMIYEFAKEKKHRVVTIPIIPRMP